MVLPSMTRASIVFRALCGFGIVGAVVAAGLQMRSPWIILPLGFVFAVLFTLGKWTAWQHAIRTLGWKSVPIGVVTTIPVQTLIVAFFYVVGMGVGALFRGDVALLPFGDSDMRFAAWTLAGGGLLGIAAHVLEVRAGPDEDYFRTQIEGDLELPRSVKDAILAEWDGEDDVDFDEEFDDEEDEA